MSNVISTNEDLLKLADDLQRLQNQQTLRVMVAVSDFPQRRLLQGFFQQNRVRNYQVFDTGTALIQCLLGSKERALLIYDLETPDKNGLELLSIIRKAGEACKNVQVVLVTGQVQRSVVEKLIASGASAILPRPISQDALVECIKTLKLAL